MADLQTIQPTPSQPQPLVSEVAETGLIPDDNGAPVYESYRKEASADDLITAARARLKPAAVPDAVTPPVKAPKAQGATSPDKRGIVARTLSTAGAAVKDVATGVIEAPKQALGGVSDLVHNVFRAGDHLGDWLNENVADLTIAVPKTGVDQLDQLIANPAEAIAGPGNQVGQPESVTGSMVRGVTQFLTGLGPAARALKVAGASKTVALVGGGVASDFLGQDPEQDTLAELIQSYPALANPITDLLSGSPDDPEIEKRFKNSVEGLLGGFLTEGLMRGVKLMAARRTVAAQGGAEGMPSKIDQPVLEADALKLLGDNTAPLVEIRDATVKPSATVANKMQAGIDAAESVDADAAAKALALSGEPGGKDVFVNFARINTADDVKSVIGQMTDAFAPQIDEARRGVRSNAATQEAADALGLSVADVLKRRKGQPFNAEEALAARQLLTSSGEKLLQSAQKAASQGATPADQYVFRKMMATHYAIQAEVIGARTETARALQSWAIPAGGQAEQMRAIEAMIQGSGGIDVSGQMAKRLALLAESGADAATLNQAIRKGAFATTMNAVREVWINGLLSSPTTHIVNTTSNFNVAMQQIMERGAAGKIAKLTGSGGVAEGEATAMMFGLMTGAKDALRAAAKTAWSGETTDVLGKMDAPRDPAVSAKAFNLDEAGGIGRTVDMLGSVLRVPGRALETQDAFFKSIGYRMELHAQAYRQASSEGLSGIDLGKRVAEIVSNPPENIKLASADAALYSTFTNETGDFGKKILELRNGGGALNPLPFILPFVRTPINIARYSFERTPLAPLVGQWRADIKAGGARRDVALARMATGSTAMAVASDLAMNGGLTGRGPKDSAERQALLRTGWQPYSVRIGDKWFSYARTDPLGQTLGFAADFTEAMNRGDIDPSDVDEWQEVMAGGIAAVSQFTVNKTYLQGIADFMNVTTDSERYGEDYVSDFTASFVPFTSAMGAAKRMVDPTLRNAETPMDAVLAKIPGLSDRLTPRRDLWGAEVKPPEIYGRAFDVLSPVKVTKDKESPIDSEMVRLRAYQEQIGKKTSFDGVPVNLRDWPEVYDTYVRMAGNELKHPAWNMGAKDFLDAVVSGKSDMSQVYQTMSDGPDGTKADFIRDTIRDYRVQAQQAIIGDPKFKRFADFIAARKQEALEAQMPQ